VVHKTWLFRIKVLNITRNSIKRRIDNKYETKVKISTASQKDDDQQKYSNNNKLNCRL